MLMPGEKKHIRYRPVRKEAKRPAPPVAYSPLFTDDASVVEFSGHPVTLYDGDPGNIKITRPIDLKIAETIIAGREG